MAPTFTTTTKENDELIVKAVAYTLLGVCVVLALLGIVVCYVQGWATKMPQRLRQLLPLLLRNSLNC